MRSINRPAVKISILAVSLSLLAGGVAVNEELYSSCPTPKAQEETSIHQQFMASPRHQRNILDPEFTEVGVGAVMRSPLIYYFTVDFISRALNQELRSTSKFYFEEASPENAVSMTRDLKAVYAFTTSQEEELVNKGIALYRQGKFEEAIQAYKEALKIDPTYVYAHYNLGLVYVAQEEFLLALESFQEAVKRRPDDPYSLYYIGYINSRLGNYQPAIDAFKKLLKIDPALQPEIFLHVHYQLGEVYELMGKKEEAISYYEKFIELARQSPYADLKTVAKAVKKLTKLKER